MSFIKKIAGGAQGLLFSGKEKASEKFESPKEKVRPVMPEDEQRKIARKKSLKSQAKRKGRASTIRTVLDDQLG